MSAKTDTHTGEQGATSKREDQENNTYTLIGARQLGLGPRGQDDDRQGGQQDQVDLVVD